MYDLSLLEMFVCNSKVQKLFFIPCAAGHPTNSKEISKLDLFQYLLKENSNLSIKEIFVEKLLQNLTEIDAESKIVQVETHRQNRARINAIDPIKPFQMFVVFKTENKKDGEFYWSLEETAKHAVVLQPYADLKPGKGIEISESLLTRYIVNKKSIKQLNIFKSEMSITTKLLGDLDRCSQIAQVQIYRRSNNSPANFMKTQLFVVFKTTSDKDGERWWSVDENADYIVLQRSRDKDAVTNKFGGKERKDPTPVTGKLVGKGSIKNLFTILWIHQVMEEKDRIKSSNCQSFVPILSKQITVRNSNVDNSPHQSDGTLDLISDLSSGISKLHPLFLPISLGNAKLFEKISEIRKCDPAKRDASGRNALEMAAMLADNTEILDLLLKYDSVEINDCDESGRTALHFAAASSNVVAARHLIKMGANPNRKDKLGRTPLHYAAFFAKDINIVDVLLNDKQVRVNSLDNGGQTALSYAECNQHGLTREIVSRLKDKCIMQRRFGNHTFVLDPVIPNANQELDPSLLPVKREGGDSDERKTQLDDPHRIATQPEGSRLKSGLKSASAKILIIFIHYTVIVLLYISKLKRSEGEESAKGFTTFFTIIGKIAKKSEINKFEMPAKRRTRAWTHPVDVWDKR